MFVDLGCPLIVSIIIRNLPVRAGRSPSRRPRFESRQLGRSLTSLGRTGSNTGEEPLLPVGY